MLLHRVLPTLALLSLLLPTYSFAQDPFALGVRTTPWLKPEEEQKKFKLPPGFEIELIAAEPQIQKPLNFAFDDRNRIWLTDSIEYPYAAPLDKPGRDTIKILEDTDGDGKYEKITTFAEGLNIPIGIYPWRKGCIAWSIPNIWYFEDTDNDGRCDRQTKLYGPFDHTRDVHGNVNALKRGWDGWLYSNHGFNNQSQVQGADGHVVTMHSGNTFRVRMDGSRIEHFTHGQVNPFGSSFDSLFNIFTADCHSKPLTQLLRGGFYQSFGKPHDGLGYVPSMMEHSHGSTAICGAAIVETENFPAEYRGQILSGNVMTSRLNRNTFVYHGSTIQAQEEPDFLSCDDPWFRPVDLHIGPDGALYMSDFYNRIIGHYEVPLPHPGRDRTSGRLWRIVYKGDTAGTKPAKMPPPLIEMPTNKLIEACDHPTLSYRLRAMEMLVEHACTSCPEEMMAALPTATPRQKTHLLWGLERMGKLADEHLTAAAKDDAREVRVHAMKLLSERSDWDEVARKIATTGLGEEDGFVARAAADAIGRHPRNEFVALLLERLQKTPAADNHLRQVLRMAVRDQLAAAEDLTKVIPPLSEAEANDIVQLVSSIKSLAATRYLARQITAHSLPEATVFAISQTVSAQAPPEETAALIGQLRERFAENLDAQLSLIDMVQKGLQQAGNKEPAAAALFAWGNDTTAKALSGSDERITWTNSPIEGKPHRDDPWVVQTRNSSDGDTQGLFFGSLPTGEQKTGVYRSSAFVLPERLSFFAAGHSGQPNAKNEKNYIRLRDAESNDVLVESRPPWNDLAQKIDWDLKKFAGRKGVVELIDGDEGNAYAWLAVGRFSVSGLNPSAAAARKRKSAELVGRLKLQERRADVVKVALSAEIDPATQQASVQALLALSPNGTLAAVAAVLADGNVNPQLRQRIAAAAVNPDDKVAAELSKDCMRQLPSRLQTTIADGLAGDANAAGVLLSLIEQGHAPATLLRLPNIANKFAGQKNDDWNSRIQKAVASLPAADVAADKLLAERKRLQDQAKPDLAKGQELFKKNCAACHQISGQGAVIGPQLDGIGLRGTERLLEDVLDPNRNVDVAFRTTTIALNSGKVVAVLVRREEGETLIAVDQLGKEIQIPKSEIDQQSRSSLSLMPANVVEIIPAAELPHLIGYLLQQRTAAKVGGG